MEKRRQARGFRQVLGVAVLPLVFMLPILAILIFRVVAVHQSEAQEQRLDLVISQTHEVHERLVDMESSLRGFLLTGEPRLLVPFAQTRAGVDDVLNSLRRESGSDPAMQTRVTILTTHYRDWLTDALAAVDHRRALPPASLRQLSMRDTTKMDAVKRDLAVMLAVQSEQRDATIAAAERSIRAEILVAILSALLAGVATGYAVRRVLVLTRIEQEAEQERLRLIEASRRAADLERENQRIQTADRLKGEYVANISHELRTPLTAILGFGELLRDGKAGPISSEQADYLDDILRSGRHLLDVIGEVLDLAKVEAGRLQLTMVAVDPKDLARDVIDGLHELAARKAISLRLDAHLCPDRVMIDPVRLRQILYNYLSNAIKFTQSGGHVIVRLRPSGALGFRLEVEDDGPGFAPDEATDLFKEYSRLSTGDRSQHGTGLGLALSKRLAEAQGGTVGATSARDKGSVFFAEFPAAARAAGSALRTLELTHA